MNKIKLFGIICAVAIIAVACGKDDEPHKLEVGSATATFEAAGGQQEVTITSNTYWGVSYGAAWLTVTPGSGNGNGKLTITAEANETAKERTANIVVSSLTAGSFNIDITQAPSAAIITATLATLPTTPIPEGYTLIITDAITASTDLSALKTVLNNSKGDIKLVLPSATAIGNDAFKDCRALSKVSLPIATNIQDRAFAGCSSIVEINLPEVTDIGYNAFASCFLPTMVTLPKATNIGEAAFWGCDKLPAISLPAVTSIGNRTFEYCSSLTDLIIDGTTKLTSVGTNIFNGFSPEYVALTLGSGEASEANTTTKMWRGYGPFKSITIK